MTQANCCLFTSAQHLLLTGMHFISVLMTGHNDGEIKYRCIGLMLLLENSGAWNLLTSDVLRSFNSLEIYEIRNPKILPRGLNAAVVLSLLWHLPLLAVCQLIAFSL